MVQTPSEGARQPIENSPPGIHTMPGGAFLGAGVGLGIVGAKGETAAPAGIVWPATATELVAHMAGDDQRVVNATTPATEAVSMFMKIVFFFMRVPFLWRNRSCALEMNALMFVVVHGSSLVELMFVSSYLVKICLLLSFAVTSARRSAATM
jgi:hypothetical protein